MGVFTESFVFFLVGYAMCTVMGAQDAYSRSLIRNPEPDICAPGPKGRVEWILHVRDSDYGWKEHTHRANIALAVNRYRGTPDETRKMGLQLEVELTRALFRNSTSRIHESDLALYIHALLATNRNPRNFHGTDLVADLLHRVNSETGNVHPFLVLALCNSRAVTFNHLLKIQGILERNHLETNHPDVDSREAQLKAIAYKAFACAASLDRSLDKFSKKMEQAANCLRLKHNMTVGTFGNVYTTSLAFQAFVSAGKTTEWNEEEAYNYLLAESEIEVNLIKAYYIEMALNARDVKFIKDLYNGSLEAPAPPLPDDGHYVQYTIKQESAPSFYFTLTLKVPVETNFYEIMKTAAGMSHRFNFSYYDNIDNLPMVYAVSGIPNDAEENMFWRICRQYDVNHDRHTSTTTTYDSSPVHLKPRKGEHITFHYLNTECP